MTKHLKNILILLSILSSLESYSSSYGRYGFSIANNQIRAEQEACKIDDLSELLYHYFTANMYNETEGYDMARYINLSKKYCIKKIKRLEKEPTAFNKKHKLQTLKRQLYVMNYFNTTVIRVLFFSEGVRIKMKAKTSYKTYIAVLSEVKKNTNRIRNELSKKLFNINYRKITVNQKSKLMRQYLIILKVLVPERIIDVPIRN